MSGIVLLCGRMFGGVFETLSGPMEILVEKDRITSVGRSVERTRGAEVSTFQPKLSVQDSSTPTSTLRWMRRISPRQTLESSASKALKGLSLARDYMSYRFTTYETWEAPVRTGPPSTFGTQSTPAQCTGLNGRPHFIAEERASNWQSVCAQHRKYERDFSQVWLVP